jgi:sulfatase maturation enzyme AslB (radical SAM superfamily)
MKKKFQTCPHALKTMYIDKVDDRYIVKPCCRPTKNDFAEKIEDIKNHDFLLKIREDFSKGTFPKVCDSCEQKENLGIPSKRTDALETPFFVTSTDNVDERFAVNHDMLDWDIRHENTCNLKCVMCGPTASSRWIEDINIYEKTFGKTKLPRGDIDWDYILENTKNKARRIYLAGGEPFYSKTVKKYLEDLSKYDWNLVNTEISIQTNGVSINNDFISILKKFKKLEFNMSLDGTQHVNYIIRYPTDWHTFQNNYRILKDLSGVNKMNFSTTVSALNLPNIEKMLEIFRTDNFSLNQLKYPEILQINALKPTVIDSVYKMSNNKFIKDLCEEYQYNDNLNKQMMEYLKKLDIKRNTQSEVHLPWCFA